MSALLRAIATSIVMLSLVLNTFSYKWLLQRVANKITVDCSIRTGRSTLLQAKESQSFEKESVARLDANVPALVNWVTNHGGQFLAEIFDDKHGWSLCTSSEVEENTVLISVPKKLCMFANPDEQQEPLLANARAQVDLLGEEHWRSRLAIALISERVREQSFFDPYVRNLPYEFLGIPIFYSAHEYRAIQDIALMQQTKDRCYFMSEFTNKVLQPLYKTARDPFSANRVDVNAFGWGFASASSRAFRVSSIINNKQTSPVLIPGLDMAAHSLQPSCRVEDGGDCYQLISSRKLQPWESLTVRYGDFSNDELLSDYGFSFDENEHDYVELYGDEAMLNTARVVMGQAKYNASYGGMDKVLTARRVALWQQFWLRSVNLTGPCSDFQVRIGEVKGQGIDPRLWAMLRILYAQSEEDLLLRGYSPELIQQKGSLIRVKEEAEVLKTLIGMLLIALRSYGTDLTRDLRLLETGDEAEGLQFTSLGTADADVIMKDCRQMLKEVILNYGDGDLTKERNNFAIADMIANENLSSNLREAVSYRLRKKSMLRRHIVDLLHLHQLLCEKDSGIERIASVIALPEKSVTRSTKIRDLIDERKGAEGYLKEDSSALAQKIASSFSKRGAGL